MAEADALSQYVNGLKVSPRQREDILEAAKKRSRNLVARAKARNEAAMTFANKPVVSIAVSAVGGGIAEEVRRNAIGRLTSGLPSPGPGAHPCGWGCEVDRRQDCWRWCRCGCACGARWCGHCGESARGQGRGEGRRPGCLRVPSDDLQRQRGREGQGQGRPGLQVGVADGHYSGTKGAARAGAQGLHRAGDDAGGAVAEGRCGPAEPVHGPAGAVPGQARRAAGTVERVRRGRRRHRPAHRVGRRAACQRR
jgi:hypothetical protein